MFRERLYLTIVIIALSCFEIYAQSFSPQQITLAERIESAAKNAPPELIHSQQVSYIRGKVINSKTSEPIPFATVRLKDHQIGVFANSDGEFKIVRNPEFQQDSLIITCIGFKKASELFKNINDRDVYVIALTPSVYSLNEVKVTASKKRLSSAAIIGRAIRNIDKCYPVKPFSYVSYYRDYQKRGNDYLNLNEAIIQTIDNGFRTESSANNYRLLDFKRNNEFPRMNISPYYDTVGSNKVNTVFKYIPNAKLGDQYGNELFVLMVHDAIRNFQTRSFSFIEIFSENFISNHIFSEPTMVLNNNMILYKIGFKGNQRITGSKVSVSGFIYVQPVDYSIHKLVYSCSSLAKGEEPKEIFNIKIEYGYENSVDKRMCLKYISFNNIFNVVDLEDQLYFRITDSYWDATNEFNSPNLVVEFNNKIDPLSIGDKGNYQINGKTPAKIADIRAKGNKLFIRLKPGESREKRDSIFIRIKGLKDYNGNILDKRKVIELYQYRELFVQEYNKSLPVTDNCFIEYKPLEQNCISKYSGSFNYWMNTPENIKIGR
jgi:hypothetical protein